MARGRRGRKRKGIVRTELSGNEGGNNTKLEDEGSGAKLSLSIISKGPVQQENDLSQYNAGEASGCLPTSTVCLTTQLESVYTALVSCNADNEFFNPSCLHGVDDTYFKLNTHYGMPMSNNLHNKHSSLEQVSTAKKTSEGKLCVKDKKQLINASSLPKSTSTLEKKAESSDIMNYNNSYAHADNSRGYNFFDRPLNLIYKGVCLVKDLATRRMNLRVKSSLEVIDRILLLSPKLLVLCAVDFFTSRRVMLVLLLIAILLGYYKFQDDLSLFTASFVVADENRPGIRFFENYTMRRKYPVMIIPGFISTALEVWEDRLECIEAQRSLASNFRQRMFSAQMLLLLILDPTCYLKLFSLDKNTGLDPPGVKIRPDMGFSASDFFLPGYWVWAKILLNLRDIGYDPQTVGVFSYDWRLSPRRMNKRDGYYYYLRSHIQHLHDRSKDKVVVISHSYGSKIFVDFAHWADKHEEGWVNKYIAYWINIGGPMLGVAKSVSAVLAGDAKDTLTLPGPMRQMLETYLSRTLRTEAMRTWSCLTAMYPIGCNAFFPDILTLPNGTRLTAKEVLQFTAQRLRESGHEAQRKHVNELLDHFEELPSLPPAHNMTVVCLYGVEKVTEVGYILSKHDVVNRDYQQTKRATNGVIVGNGDGTVPLMSLGYMCRAKNGWKQNVSRIITREHKYGTELFMNFRGGSTSGDHVDILGNYDLIETILMIVSGNSDKDELHDRIYSDVDERIANATECLSP